MSNLLLKSAARAAKILPQPVRRAFYRLGPVTIWIRRVLNRAAPEGLTMVKVAAGPAAGLDMRLDLQREKDYWLGSYETELLDAVGELVRPGMVVYDVGANIGYLSLVFARLVAESGQVFSFEALPGNAARLQDHAALNGFADRIHLQQAAVVERTGPVTFLVHPSHGMGKAAGSAGRDAEYTQQIEVDGIAIDDFIFRDRGTPPDAVKMDIEGGEVLALQGMHRTLAEVRPVVFLELHGEAAAAAAWDALVPAGYTLHRLGKHRTRVHALAELDWKAYVVALPGKVR